MPDGAVLLDASALEPDETEWRTGGVIDLYNGLYRILCRPTKERQGFSPAEVDAMDLSTVAVLLGVSSDPGAADRAELAEIARRRNAGEDVSWEVEGWEDMNARRRPPDPPPPPAEE